MNLKAQLNKANNIFTKARTQYTRIVNECEREKAQAESQIANLNKYIAETSEVQAQAENSVNAINKIVGE